MDFLDPKKRRAHGIRLMIGYVLMAIALGIGTTILVLATSGYGFDRKTGTIIQNGLLFVDSHPVSAEIFINGKDRGGTDGRFVLEEGNYSVELRREGYRTWKQDFALEGASVERLVYPFLFPSTLKTSDVQLYGAAPTMSTQSPDRHWIVTHNVSSLNTFQVTDANTDDNATLEIEVPASILVPHEGDQKLTAVEWSTNNRHFLVRHEYQGGVDYVVIDRESPSGSINVNQALGKAYTQVTFRDKKFDQIYGIDASGQLQTADLKTKSVGTIAQQVAAFFPYKDNVLLYASSTGAAKDRVNVKLRENTTDYTLRTLPSGSRYLLNIASFNGDMHVVAGATSEGRAYLYRDPLVALKKVPPQMPPAKALLKADNAQYASFSANARFVAVQGAGSFAIYDLEMNRQFRYNTGLQVPAELKANWMDGHRLSLVSDGKVNIFDFDGTNRQTLGAADASFQPFFDRDYKALFTVSPSATVPNKPALLRTELVVED